VTHFLKGKKKISSKNGYFQENGSKNDGDMYLRLTLKEMIIRLCVPVRKPDDWDKAGAGGWLATSAKETRSLVEARRPLIFYFIYGILGQPIFR
jgi:hypothetical protein